MTDDSELQACLIRLLVAADPHWERPVGRGGVGDDVYRRFQLLEATRLQLSGVLWARPEWVVARGGEVFAVILLDDGWSSQLVHPFVAAVGRRVVLERLIGAVEDEGLPYQLRANAAQAAYWVRCWEPRELQELRRAAVVAGAGSAAEVNAYVQRHRRPERVADDIDDLWPRFWRSCVVVFVGCEDSTVRRRLQTAFPLESTCYPDEFAGMIRAAMVIAEADAAAFERLLNGSTGFGHSI
ncbi:hypothetical protein [Nocardia sp. NPDC051832]|uniref:hypothetical protein n=1 Tax=Nocardia sp. NPDC051832 TaxID=3155673 RepID=UPI0034215B26